jgi:hypothetical protein
MLVKYPKTNWRPLEELEELSGGLGNGPTGVDIWLVTERGGKRLVNQWINWSGYYSPEKLKADGYIMWAIQETPIIPEGNL